jgi:hypothetical protein
MGKGRIAETYPVLSLYILAAILVPGILFLIYCFVSFSRAERHEGRRPTARSIGEQKRNHGREGMYKTVLAALALTIPATLAAQTTQAFDETTAKTEHNLADGFLVCGKWRREFSNAPRCLTGGSGVLKRDQDTSTQGMTWQFGRKRRAW